MERWDARLRRERGEDPRPEEPVLKLIRDALEHLDEADFEEGDAVPPPPQKKKDPKGRALRQLPAGRLPLTLGASDQGLGSISSREVEQRAYGSEITSAAAAPLRVPVGVRLALFINAGFGAKKVFRVTGTKAILRVRAYVPGAASDPRLTPGAGGMY
ncbi:hypothetical protein ACEZDB_32310 [Streptacidiphilus sp. N1-3]|uniref:Uncharacterized protein n=1 Tax=Streptacidiphilus alkalitolerans TaxID=3342712 RepID=A0ABV6XAQ2_9ACTN